MFSESSTVVSALLLCALLSKQARENSQKYAYQYIPAIHEVFCHLVAYSVQLLL